MSGQNDPMSDSFTIPKRIPKKKLRDDDPPSFSSTLPPMEPSGESPPSRRKLLPTRASRSSDLTPEWEAMLKLITQFYARVDAAPFREPVDWKALGLFDYPQIIKLPMDLGTVKRRVIEGKYKSVFESAEDIRLVWRNCMTYNRVGNDYHTLAQKLSKRFEEKYEKLCAKNGGVPAPSKTFRRQRSKEGSSAAEDHEKKPPGLSSSKVTTLTPSRSSGRNAKRKRSVYAEELEDTGSDDLMTSGEEEQLEERRKKRLAWKKKKEAPPEEKQDAVTALVEEEAEAGAGAGAEAEAEAAVSYKIEAPPPGEMHCLWYSREPFRYVFAMEKVLGWKTRSVVKLETCESNTTANDCPKTLLASAREKLHSVDFDEAMKIKEKAEKAIGNDFCKRRGISRINPGSCPIIARIVASQELAKSKDEGRSPKFKLVKDKQKREEVFLIKWRGRSYIHCSWERLCDLVKYDQSTQPGAARGKISRFVQSQVASFGVNWKKVLEEERNQSAPAAKIHQPHSSANTGYGSRESSKGEDSDEESLDDNDYFSPLYVEVDRIVGCDENELDMGVLARQRALNICAEREALKKREKEDEAEEKRLRGEHGEDGDAYIANGEQDTSTKKNGERVEEEWDPEDNVRYIVRWKGLQLTEATWEYWIDIKMDFVDEVEDFWLRQQAPSPEKVREMAKEHHPHPRDFKKMKESPIFGISQKDRPIAKLEDNYETSDTDKENDNSGSVLKLREYQLEGVNWLLWNWYNRRSCILADEMGLGKTIQSIGFLDGLQQVPNVNLRGPFLIVAPLSLVSQWESEAKEWVPDMNVIVYHGNADARDFLVKQEFYYTEQFETKSRAKSLRQKHITKFQLVVTTYEVILKDVNILSKIHWKVLIVDEAHRLKNIKSKLFEDLASVPRDFCLLLTGTPLQNSTEELWALLNFADPKAFRSKEEFTNQFGQLQDAHQVADLHTVLRPYLLRRVKEDVEKALPPKEETILEVTLTPVQKQFYKAVYEKNTSFLFKGTKPSNAPSLMNVMMELRKCCNHPFLIRGAEDRIVNDAAEGEHKLLTPNEQKYRPIDYAKLTGEQLVKSSGKFVLLSKLLQKLESGGHKVLIFSQMVRVLDLLQELLQLNHYRYERLDGTCSASARNAAVDRFKRDSFKRFVMLLSTRAGGLGLNLTAADTVIIFDSDWNPQNDLQAMARAHRIGQTKSVRVYRLLTAKTYEMHMFHSASLKLGLDRAVLAHQRQNTNSDEISSKRKSKAEKEEQAKEIDNLLKRGAYDVFNDDDDAEAHKFMDTDIDELLEQSSRKVTYGEAATNSLSSGLGSFSKASFVASTGEGDGKDVDLDDPDFWSKAVGLEAPPEEPDPTMALIIGDGSKRARKQVQAFDPFKEDAEAEEKRLQMIAQKKQEEKEEKERKKLEKFLKKEAEREAKEKARREERELKEKLKEKKMKAAREQRESKAKEAKRKMKEVRVVYNDRKTDRKRALKRAEHDDPIYERVRQAWDTSQRNRVVNTILKFGFLRFCKIRHDSNYTSLPIQDVEVFVRSYIYQVGLQAAVTLLSNVNCSKALGGDLNVIVQTRLKKVLGPLIGEGKDFDWVCTAILTSLCMHMRMKSHDAFLRLPLTLAEPAFLHDLRQGVAIRSLHRLSFLSRLNSIIEEALDRTIEGVGREAMGSRGCLTNDYSTLDIDLKARYVTTEELMYALSTKLNPSLGSHHLTRPPWWDRSCDLGLVIGTFFHGLGNYDAMRNDRDLPFANKIKSYVMCNDAEAESYSHFEAAADAAKQVFDTALVTMKRKFQEQTHAAVAAVFAATKTSGETKPAYLVKTQEMDDDDIVSLDCLKDATVKAFRKPFDSSPAAKKKSSLQYSLPLPDCKHLDYLLDKIVENLESSPCPPKHAKRNDQEYTNILAKDSPEQSESSYSATTLATRKVLQASKHSAKKVLFAGNLSGIDKKPQDDASDYFLGAASQDLASLAVGADSSRYQRGPCVPMIVTKYVLGGILLAEENVIECLAKKPYVNLKKSSNQDHQHSSSDTVGDEKKEESHSALATTTAISEESKDLELRQSEKQPAEMQSTWQYIKNDASLRASICTALLHGGYPSSFRTESFVKISVELGLELSRNPVLLQPFPSPTTMTECRFFSMENAFRPALTAAGIEWSDQSKSLDEYFQTVLLPFCLKLCLTLAAEQTNIANEQGKTDVYVGRPSYETLSPLPDPFIPLENHSEEAMSNAYAILRRTRLMKSIRFIIGGGVPLKDLTGFLHGSVWLNQTVGIPVWWCPWIHDLGLLVHAALYGLASITTVLPLQHSSIEQHVRETFIDGTLERMPFLPKCFLDQAPKEEIDTWVEMHSKQFPTFHIVEHRLALVCSHLTAGTSCQYDNVPMFDEGGWPMAEDITAPGFLADMRSSGSRCFLSAYESLDSI